MPTEIKVLLLGGPVILKRHPFWAAQLEHGTLSGAGTILPNCLVCSKELSAHSGSLGLDVLVQTQPVQQFRAAQAVGLRAKGRTLNFVLFFPFPCTICVLDPSASLHFQLN